MNEVIAWVVFVRPARLRQSPAISSQVGTKGWKRDRTRHSQPFLCMRIRMDSRVTLMNVDSCSWRAFGPGFRLWWRLSGDIGPWAVWIQPGTEQISSNCRNWDVFTSGIVWMWLNERSIHERLARNGCRESELYKSATSASWLFDSLIALDLTINLVEEGWGDENWDFKEYGLKKTYIRLNLRHYFWKWQGSSC